MRHIQFIKNKMVNLQIFNTCFYSKLIFLRIDNYFMLLDTHFLKLPHSKLCMMLLYEDEFGKEYVSLSNL